ncbi:MAG TPA: hypothetical protein VEJ84_04790, partial [Acidimicrobiales bacterium]|nr:hypothetical protein [Acidimicrobiales bacterium]
SSLPARTLVVCGSSAGVAAKLVSELLGDANVMITLDTYSHVRRSWSPDDLSPVDSAARSWTLASP